MHFLQRIYDEHAQALFAFLLHLTRNESDARDILQEVLIKLAREPALAVENSNERAFLIRIGYRLVIDQFRRRRAREARDARFGGEVIELFTPAADPDEHAFDIALAQALGELPDEQRAVVQLKLWQDCTFEEIATALEISPNTAASRYRYGLDKLRERLRSLYESIQ